MRWNIDWLEQHTEGHDAEHIAKVNVLQRRHELEYNILVVQCDAQTLNLQQKVKSLKSDHINFTSR